MPTAILSRGSITPSPLRHFRLALALTTALGTSLGIGPAFASPDGPTVVGGRATINLGSTTQVRQTGQRAIINWRSFSLGEGERFEVFQPNSNALLLNRITGGNASRLDGTVSANGQVVFINPAGVMIGRNARIDAAGLIATTSDIGNADFMAGRLNFSRASSFGGASVENEGIINVADDGYAVLSAAMVSNTGAVNARLGSVVLGGAEAFTLDLEGDGLLSYRMAEASVPAVVQNSGSLSAAGGSVLLTAASVRGVIGSVINTDGVIEAQTVRNVGGRIMIVAEGGDVSIGGTIDASSASRRGGAISVDGNTIAVEDATISADGARGGGTIRIGTMNANADHDATEELVVGAGAHITADATANGDGGNLAFLSETRTRFDGEASARGAGQGDGGQAEISSHLKLEVTGRVDLTAQAGMVGTLLLDPVDIHIVAGSGNDTSFTTQTLLGVDFLLGQLATSNITLSTTDRQGPVTGSIFIDTPIEYTGASARSLIFRSTGDINVSNTINSTNAPLNVNFEFIGTSGNLYLESGITINGGKLSIISSNNLTYLSDKTLIAIGNTANIPGNLIVTELGTAAAADSAAADSIGSIDISGAQFRNIDSLNFDGVAGNVLITATTGVLFDAPVTAIGNIEVQSGGSVNIGSTLTSGGKILVNSQGSTGLVIGSDGGVFSTAATDGEIVLVGKNGFSNGAGSSAVSVSSGRYLLYVPGYNLQNTDLGGLTGVSLYNHIYDGPEFIAGSANRIIYEQAASATVTGGNFSRQYGQANPLFSGIVSGLVNGDTISDFGPVSYTTSADTSANVDVYTINPLALNPLNYTLSYLGGTLAVTRAPLTVRANNFSRQYGEANPLFSGIVTGLVNGDTISDLGPVSYTTSADTSASVGSYTINPLALNSLNYTINYLAGTLAVTPAPLTVQANNFSRQYGQANPLFSGIVTGLVNGDTISDLGPVSYTTSADTSASVGSYTINPLALNPLNYTVNYLAGTLAVTRAPLTVRANNFSRQYGEANPLFSGIVTGLVNGDTISDLGPVSYTTSADTSASVGVYTINSLALNPLNYTVNYLAGTLAVTRAPLTVRANNFSRQMGQSNPNFTASFQGLRLGDQGSVVQGLGFSTTALPDSPTGNYVIDVFGGQAQNYTLAYVAGNLNVTGSLIGGSGGGLPNSVTNPPPPPPPPLAPPPPPPQGAGGFGAGTPPPAGLPPAPAPTASVLSQTLTVASIDAAPPPPRTTSPFGAPPPAENTGGTSNASQPSQTSDRDGAPVQEDAPPPAQGDGQGGPPAAEPVAANENAGAAQKAPPPPEGDTPPPPEDGASGNSDQETTAPVIPGILAQVPRGAGTAAGGVAGLQSNFPNLGRAW